MGPTALVADDVTTGHLIAPFPAMTLPARGYHAYLPDARAGGFAPDRIRGKPKPSAAGKKLPVIVAAIAREIAVFLWAIGREVAPA